MADRFILCGVECQVIACGNCGVTHAIPAVLYDKCVEEGGFWHCPNGHSRGFHESASLREKKRREVERIKQDNARLEHLVSDTAATAAAAVRKLERHKKRSASGVCPCCTRTFSNMTRHMKTKHPEYMKNVVSLKAVKA